MNTCTVCGGTIEQNELGNWFHVHGRGIPVRVSFMRPKESEAWSLIPDIKYFTCEQVYSDRAWNTALHCQRQAGHEGEHMSVGPPWEWI